MVRNWFAGAAALFLLSCALLAGSGLRPDSANAAGATLISFTANVNGQSPTANVTLGQPFTFNASAQGNLISGDIQFILDGNVVTTQSCATGQFDDENGRACGAFTWPGGPINTSGVHTAFARLINDPTYAQQDSNTVTLNVFAGTSVVITAQSPAVSEPNEAVTVTARVDVTPPALATATGPSGTVTISSPAANAPCTATVNLSNHLAICSLVFASVGQAQITAHYNGDAVYLPSSPDGTAQHQTAQVLSQVQALKSAISGTASPQVATKLSTYLNSIILYFGYHTQTWRLAACQQLVLFESALTAAKNSGQIDLSSFTTWFAQAESIRSQMACPGAAPLPPSGGDGR